MKRFKNILFVADRERGLDAALERAVALDATDGVAYGYLAELYATAGSIITVSWLPSTPKAGP